LTRLPTTRKRLSKLSADRQRRFCEVLERKSRGRPQWYVNIDSIARQLGIDWREATLLAAECEQAGLVVHDLSSSAMRHRRAMDIPHSVALLPDALAIIRKKQR
jgi:hypothetical protein